MSTFAADALPVWAIPIGFWVGVVLSISGAVYIGVTFVKRTRWRPSMIATTIVIISSVGLIVGLGLMYFEYRKREQYETKVAGEPKDFGTLEQPVEVRVEGKKHELIRAMEFGNSGAVLNKVTAGPIFSFMEKSNLTIEVIDNELKVSTSIHDKDGELVAEIIENEWKTAPATHSWNVRGRPLIFMAAAGEPHLCLMVEID